MDLYARHEVECFKLVYLLVDDARSQSKIIIARNVVQMLLMIRFGGPERL